MQRERCEAGNMQVKTYLSRRFSWWISAVHLCNEGEKWWREEYWIFNSLKSSYSNSLVRAHQKVAAVFMLGGIPSVSRTSPAPTRGSPQDLSEASLGTGHPRHQPVGCHMSRQGCGEQETSTVPASPKQSNGPDLGLNRVLGRVGRGPRWGWSGLMRPISASRALASPNARSRFQQKWRVKNQHFPGFLPLQS